MKKRMRRFVRRHIIAPQPQPGDRPTGVFIVNKATGEKLPCELSYVGVDDEGMHEWRVATTVDLVTEYVRIGMLPPHTSVSLPAAPFEAQG